MTAQHLLKMPDEVRLIRRCDLGICASHDKPPFLGQQYLFVIVAT